MSKKEDNLKNNSLAFKGKTILLVRDKYNCFHLYKKKSRNVVELKTYINYLNQIKSSSYGQIVQSFIINDDDKEKKYMWCSNEIREGLNQEISPNHQKYIDFLKESQKGIRFLGPYKSKNTRGMHVCSKGHEWFIQPKKVMQGEKCPKCKLGSPLKIQKSIGEKFIAKFLEELEVEFIREVSLKSFGHERDLRLDFLICKNNYPLFAIEYNGIQHYKPISSKHFGGYEGFKKNKTRDKMKRYYCWNLGLPIVEIPYTESEEEIKGTISYFLNLYEISIDN